VAAYLVLVGAPVLGLLGILEAGRAIAAPVSVGGEWKIEPDSAVSCADVPAGMSISQSGAYALITLKDGETMDGAVSGATLSGKSLQASIAGNAAGRTLQGTMRLNRCGLIAFRAARQPRKQGE